jgi:hypothetical protein
VPSGFTRRYLIEFGGASALYAVLLILSIVALKSIPQTSALRVPLAVLPMVGGVLIVVAVVRQLGRIDELQRRTLLEAIAIAFAGTGVITFAYGFLQGVGFPQVSWLAIWPIMATLWALGSFVSFRRYR